MRVELENDNFKQAKVRFGQTALTRLNHTRFLTTPYVLITQIEQLSTDWSKLTFPWRFTSDDVTRNLLSVVTHRRHDDSVSGLRLQVVYFQRVLLGRYCVSARVVTVSRTFV